VERGNILMFGPSRQLASLPDATPLQWCMRWDIISLVKSVNLIRVKRLLFQ